VKARLPQSGQIRTYAYSSLISIAGQAVLLVTGPLLARLYGPSQRGELALLILISSLLSAIVSFGIPAAASYLLARGVPSPELRPPLIRIFLMQCLILVALLAAALFLLSGRLRTLHTQAAFLIVPVAGLAASYAISVALGVGALRRYNEIRLLPTLCYGLSVLTAFALRAAPSTFVILWAAGQLASFMAAAWYLHAQHNQALANGARNGPGRYSVRSLLAMGRKTALAVTSPVDYFPVDQLLTAGLLSNEALGLYVVALSYSSACRLVGLTISGPLFAAVAAAKSHQVQRARKAAVISNLTVAAFAIPIIAAVPFTLRPVFGSAFAPAETPAILLVLGGAAAAARRLNADLLRALANPAKASRIEVEAFVLQAVLSVCFVFPFRLNGVAAAVLLSSGISYTRSLRWVLQSSREESAHHKSSTG